MSIRIPKTTISVSPASTVVQNKAQKILFVGQKTSAGTATSGQLYTDIANDASQNRLFGKNSLLALGITAAKRINKICQFDAIPLDDNISGIAATGIISFPSPTVAGTINLSIGSKKNNIYEIPITAGEDGGDIAIAAAALINADTYSCVTATAPTSIISDPVFTGTGLDDLSVSGVYSGSASTTYIIEIDGTVPDTFQWSDDNGATWTTGVTITGSSQLLSNGVSITFAAITGHTLGDIWTITVTADLLTLTAVNKGTEGNFISIKVTADFDYSATITKMSGGATNPALTDLFNVINNLRYQWIVYPSSYDITPLTDLLDPRWNADNNILDGVGVLSATGNKATLQSFVAGKNDQNFIYHCNKAIDRSQLKGSALLEIDYVIASEVAAIGALRLTEGANIANYVISTKGIRDNIGGMAIASLPIFNTPFYDLPIIEAQDEWTDDEIEDLNNAGGFVLGNNEDKNRIISGFIVTTYKTDPASNEDISYKYLEYVNTISQIREYFYRNLKKRYDQFRLTNGYIQPNRNMTNAAIIGSLLDSIYVTLASSDYVLTQIGVDETTGIDYLAFFKENRSVTIDTTTGKATISMIVPIVTQLRVIYASIQLGFSTNS